VQFLSEGSGKAVHEYEFGDIWLHRLERVSREQAGPDSPLAWLVNGSRRGQDVTPHGQLWTLIRRRTADRLVAGMAERTYENNTDADKPLYVERLPHFRKLKGPAH
jgi:hypothetical protein